MECSFCNRTLNDSDRFCSSCGRLIERGNQPSGFEIGRIAALDSIKRDIIKWIGGTNVILAIIVGVLAWFGINEAITSRVTSQVADAVQTHKDTIQEVTKDIGIAIGNLQQKKEDLFGEITELSSKKQELYENLESLSVKNHDLDQQIKMVSQKKDKLLEILNKTQFPFVFAMLEHNLYNLRDLRIKSKTIFPLSVKPMKPWKKEFSGFQIELKIKQGDQLIAQFLDIEANGGPTVEFLSDVIAISRTHKLPFPSEDNLLYKHVNVLDGVDLLEVSIVSMKDKMNNEKDEKIRKILESIKNIELDLLANGMPVWNFQLRPRFKRRDTNIGPHETVEYITELDVSEQFKDCKRRLEESLG